MFQNQHACESHFFFIVISGGERSYNFRVLLNALITLANVGSRNDKLDCLSYI